MINLNVSGFSTFVGFSTFQSDVFVAGVVTATSFVGDGSGLTGVASTDNIITSTASTFANINSTGIITAAGGFNIGIQSAGIDVATGVITALNFIGAGNTFLYNAGTKTLDVSIQGGGAGAGGTWATYTAGIATNKSVGVNTSTLDDNDLVGAGNSFQGLYVGNGMIIVDNQLNGDHYIGTNFNGLMAGPVTVNGTLNH